MTSSDSSSQDRQRGSVRARGGSLQVRVYAGNDPVTGRPRYLTETVKGTDRAARRRADKSMTKLLAQVDRQRAPSTAVMLGYALDEWLRTSELGDSTRHGYAGRTHEA